ncbi:hypothetical protein FA13DRAFT_1140137 [Coprinellus micaceus]|uniref:Secreted protein n=1 Tax=Coprinellus micaceus TaxID=71717 RepID=A0A4Y7SV09_COPMI|nr:hypothetical protein FA13DRAFT_1140137 [Coprinellus micaceus]
MLLTTWAAVVFRLTCVFRGSSSSRETKKAHLHQTLKRSVACLVATGLGSWYRRPGFQLDGPFHNSTLYWRDAIIGDNIARLFWIVNSCWGLERRRLVRLRDGRYEASFR